MQYRLRQRLQWVQRNMLRGVWKYLLHRMHFGMQRRMLRMHRELLVQRGVRNGSIKEA